MDTVREGTFLGGYLGREMSCCHLPASFEESERGARVIPFWKYNTTRAVYHHDICTDGCRTGAGLFGGYLGRELSNGPDFSWIDSSRRFRPDTGSSNQGSRRRLMLRSRSCSAPGPASSRCCKVASGVIFVLVNCLSG
jgi:hypothetical protein